MRKSLISLMLMLLAAVIAVPTLSTPANAQSALNEDQKAVIAFDFRMKKMMEGDFVKEMGGADAMQLPPGAAGNVDPKKIERVFGVVRLPDNVQTIMDMQAGPPETLPLDIYISMTFVDKESADAMFKEVEDDSIVETIGGKKYYRPKGPNEPDNLMAARPSDTTLEFGTTNFMTQTSKRDLFSKGLDAAWKKVPDDNLRVAIDLIGAKKLITEVIDMGKQGGDAMTGAYLDLIGKAKNIRFSLDMDKENILTLAASGLDEDGSEEIRGGLDSLLAMAQLAGKNGVNMVPDDDVKGVANEILDSLTAKRDGSEVTVAIPKPKGFAKSMKKLQEIIPMMMGFGGPPPGEGF